MKTKLIVLSVILLLAATILAPAAITSAKIDKVEVTIHFNQPSIIKGEKIIVPSGIIFRNDYIFTYNLDVLIDGVPTKGVAVAYTDYMDSPIVHMLVYHQYIVITFDSMPGGTFEGNAALIIQDYTPTSFDIKTHGLFHGTGAYDGQFINAGQDGDATSSWTGYIFK